MSIEAWIGAAGVLGTVGGGLATWFVKHAKKHQQIDDRLAAGDGGFGELRQSVGVVEKRTARIETAVRELLVHSKLRKPGQGINGEQVE